MTDEIHPVTMIALYALALCVGAFLAGIFFKLGWTLL
jgi:hypothetical protein